MTDMYLAKAGINKIAELWIYSMEKLKLFRIQTVMSNTVTIYEAFRNNCIIFGN